MVPKVKFVGKAHASPGTPHDSHYLLGDMCIEVPHEKARVTTKTRGVISSLGEIIAHDMSFNPIVNVVDKVMEKHVHRFIHIECPGVVEDDIELEDMPNGVKISHVACKARSAAVWSARNPRLSTVRHQQEAPHRRARGTKCGAHQAELPCLPIQPWPPTKLISHCFQSLASGSRKAFGSASSCSSLATAVSSSFPMRPALRTACSRWS